VLSDGDPKVYAAELYARMSRLERWRIDDAFAERLLREGAGFRFYPDNESPTSVAKRSFQEGIARAVLIVTAPFLLVFAGAISFLDFGVHNAATLAVFASSGVVVVGSLGAWALRLRTIGRYFETHSPGTGEVS
jgi:hypothetical protein